MGAAGRKHSDYLIVGSSHAGMGAVAAIRMADRQGSITVVTREQYYPYSPTVLPYVVSGHTDPGDITLRDEDYFTRHQVEFLRGAALTAVDAGKCKATLNTGQELGFGKLLLATGARPRVPSLPGLPEVPYHVLRTLDDALDLRTAIEGSGNAIVLGAGLVGMHAVHNLAEAGLKVTVVRARAPRAGAEPQVLPDYFDNRAARLIASIFSDNGVDVAVERHAVEVARRGGGCAVTLDNGEERTADLLFVSTGVEPELGYLEGSGVETDQGVLVDDTMRSSVDNIWAAGDIAQAADFFGTGKIINGILPDAVEQGRIAGMAMAGDEGIKPYPGGVSLNTFRFFGQEAASVGTGITEEAIEGAEVDLSFDAGKAFYRKIVIEQGRLLGIAGINAPMDPGIMWQLILRRVDLEPVKTDFLARPLETGRILMSRLWR